MIMDEYQKASREYLISLLTTIKKTRQAIEKQQIECDIWSRRVKLAEENDKPQLLEEARRRLTEAIEAKQRLADEEQQVLQEFREAQTRYDIEASLPEESVSAEQLLQSLHSITGEPDFLQEQIRSADAEAELQKLKREMEKK